MRLALVLSPAKKMNVVDGPPYAEGVPHFIGRTEQLMKALQALPYDELKTLWKTSDKLTALNAERLRDMDLGHGTTAAVISYEGIAFQHLAASIMDGPCLDYLRDHLRILSGFYGVLAPFDGVVPYRLEMQAKVRIDGFSNLYDFWGPALHDEVTDESHVIVNLASKEYARAIERHLSAGERYLTCVFGELRGGRVVQRGVYAKMARGEMVRYMASVDARRPEQIQGFDRSGYVFDPDRSSEKEYCFIRKTKNRT
jgi:cytoplasmic iron level regulating protein YaaA (DUF328/UPF0246 family)